MIRPEFMFELVRYFLSPFMPPGISTIPPIGYTALSREVCQFLDPIFAPINYSDKRSIRSPPILRVRLIVIQLSVLPILPGLGDLAVPLTCFINAFRLSGIIIRSEWDYVAAANDCNYCKRFKNHRFSINAFT